MRLTVEAAIQSCHDEVGTLTWWYLDMAGAHFPHRICEVQGLGRAADSDAVQHCTSGVKAVPTRAPLRQSRAGLSLPIPVA